MDRVDLNFVKVVLCVLERRFNKCVGIECCLDKSNQHPYRLAATLAATPAALDAIPFTLATLVITLATSIRVTTGRLFPLAAASLWLLWGAHTVCKCRFEELYVGAVR